MSQNANPVPSGNDRTTAGYIAILFGVLMVAFSLMSVINTAFDLNITVKGTPLPKHWDATIGLIGATGVFWGIWSLINFIPAARGFSRRRPWIMAAIVVLFLVGAIVGITIWDNGNIKERHEAFMAEQKADSLDRIEDSKTFFIGDIPYRLAVLNPEAEPIEVWMDEQSVGTIAPYEALELKLPWQAARISVKKAGKEMAGINIQPDPSKGKDPALLHVYSPMKNLNIWLMDDNGAYHDGKLSPAQDFEPDMVETYYGQELFEVTNAGPLFIYPNQAAPATTKYHVYRFVIMPDAIEEPRDNRPFVAWALRRADKRTPQTPPESADAQFEAWKAEQ